jgi:RNA polymerase sigma factor (sigma-70 family)
MKTRTSTKLLNSCHFAVRRCGVFVAKNLLNIKVIPRQARLPIYNTLKILLSQKKPNIIQTVGSYGKQLLGFIRQRVNTDEDAEDILQDVWYQLSTVPEIEAIEQMSSWLYRVARNRIIDKYRKQKPESLEDHGYEDEDGEFHFKDILLADDNTPETAYLKDLFWEQLNIALDELPENQRQVFIWNELEDQTFQEIADRTGENIKTLISRKRYAVRHLRERLESVYREFVNY